MTDVPLIENLAAIGLVLAAIVLLVKVAARIYRGAALRIGAKVPILDAWRAAEH